MTARPARSAGAKVMSLVFRFGVSIDDRKVEVLNRPGDAVRLRSLLGGGDALDRALDAGGTEAYEVLFRFAWQACRHHDEYTTITWDEFIDRCETWEMLDDDDGADALRPTDAGPSNE